MAPVELTPSAYRHGFEFDQALYVMSNALATGDLGSVGGQATVVFVGYPHDGSARRVELIAEIRQPRTVVVFHFSDLTDNYRHLWPTDEG
ncbi:MAG: hypothetical protein LBC97_07915 [Bifidobacteriaceae bacterium]|jgi:hypothetical protein|nr:hypothetical protein [Bifidobacteriaceae bacterium]